MTHDQRVLSNIWSESMVFIHTNSLDIVSVSGNVEEILNCLATLNPLNNSMSYVGNGN